MPLGATLSIVGVDRKSGEIGAAVASQSFSSGSQTIWAEPGVGIVVVQGTVEPTYGPLGLALLKGGKTPPQALKSLLATDPHPAVRQVMMIDSRGRVVAHSGKACLPESGAQPGRGFCVQASFVEGRRVWRTMAADFRAERGPLAHRLVAALEGGERGARGGAPRSAAVTVVESAPSSSPWGGRLLDLRVENGENPLRALRVALRARDAYGLAEAAEQLISRGDVAKGEREFEKAIALSQGNQELRLRFALGMLRAGEERKGLSLMRMVVGRGKDVKVVIREMAARGVIGTPGKKPEAPSQSL